VPGRARQRPIEGPGLEGVRAREKRGQGRGRRARPCLRCAPGGVGGGRRRGARGRARTRVRTRSHTRHAAPLPSPRCLLTTGPRAAGRAQVGDDVSFLHGAAQRPGADHVGRDPERLVLLSAAGRRLAPRGRRWHGSVREFVRAQQQQQPQDAAAVCAPQGQCGTTQHLRVLLPVADGLFARARPAAARTRRRRQHQWARSPARQSAHTEGVFAWRWQGRARARAPRGRCTLSAGTHVHTAHTSHGVPCPSQILWPAVA